MDRFLKYGKDFWFRMEGSHPEEKFGQAVKKKNEWGEKIAMF